MKNTYAVYGEEYYFSMNNFSTILKKRVYTVSDNQDDADEVKGMMDETLRNTIASGEINAKNEMLTAYNLETICLEGQHSIDEAKQLIIDDDYTWGKVEGRHR